MCGSGTIAIEAARISLLKQGNPLIHPRARMDFALEHLAGF